MQMVLYHGLPGSGKTSSAMKVIRPGKDIVVCRDDIRKEQYGKYWSKDIDENWITKIHKERIINAFENEYSVIIPDTNLNKQRNQKLIYLAAQYGAEVDHVYIDTPIPVAVRYADNRGEKTVKEDVIRAMAKRAGINELGRVPRHDYHYPIIDHYSPDYSLPTAYIVDIDGTCAHALSGRSMFDYSRIHEDTTDYSVLETVNTLALEHKIIFMSGRSDECFASTKKWLEDALPRIDFELHMRPKQDQYTPDFIVKNKMFDEIAAPRYNVLGCIDDRRQVIAMYRTKGVKVYDVANGRF